MKQILDTNRLTEKLMELRYNKQVSLKNEKTRFLIRQNGYKELINQEERNQGNSSLSTQDKKRWSRQLQHGLINQKKIRDARVVVFGVGGIGSNALMGLIYSGVKNYKIIDYDKVKLSNLNRQTLYTPDDVNKLKIEIAEERLLKIYSNINIVSFNIQINYPKECNVFDLNESEYPTEISKINDIIKWGDIVVNALDYQGAPYLINDLCVKTHKPFYWAGVNHSIGEIYSYNPNKKTPCLRCIFGPSDFINKSQFLRYKKLDDNAPKGINVGSTVIATGNFISEMILHDICEIYNPNHGQLVIYDALDFKIHKIPIVIDEQCLCQ